MSKEDNIENPTPLEVEEEIEKITEEILKIEEEEGGVEVSGVLLSDINPKEDIIQHNLTVEGGILDAEEIIIDSKINSETFKLYSQSQEESKLAELEEEVLLEEEKSEEELLEEEDLRSAKQDLERIKKLIESEEDPRVNNAIVDESFILNIPPNEDQVKVFSEVPDHKHSNILPNSSLHKIIPNLLKSLVKLNKNKTEFKEKVDEINLIFSNLEAMLDKTGVDKVLTNNPTALMKQGIESTETGKMVTMSSVELNATDPILKGEAAILKANKAFGLGDIVNIPLPHSGFWVSVNPCDDSDLVSFYKKIANLKNQIGIETSGFGFTNHSVITNEELFKFIKNHIRVTSIKDFDMDKLDEYININDLYILGNGFAAASYPEGILFKRPCNLGVSCDELHEAVVDLKKLLWIDNNRFTEEQKKIFSKVRPKSITLEDVKIFTDKMNDVKENNFTHRSGKFVFKIPSLKEHFEDGKAWVEDIDRIVDNNILSGEYEAVEQLSLVQQYARLTKLREWTHFIDYIEIDGSRIEGRADIAKILTPLSSSVSFIERFSKAVVDFRNATIKAVIGIPEYTCPSCQSKNEAPEGDVTLKNIIPIDPLSLCFLALITKLHMAAMESDFL